MYIKYIKRIIDIIISTLFMPLYIVLFIVLAPFIYFSDKGPIFYNEERLGKKRKDI